MLPKQTPLEKTPPRRCCWRTHRRGNAVRGSGKNSDAARSSGEDSGAARGSDKDSGAARGSGKDSGAAEDHGGTVKTPLGASGMTEKGGGKRPFQGIEVGAARQDPT